MNKFNMLFEECQSLNALNALKLKIDMAFDARKALLEYQVRRGLLKSREAASSKNRILLSNIENHLLHNLKMDDLVVVKSNAITKVRKVESIDRERKTFMGRHVYSKSDRKSSSDTYITEHSFKNVKKIFLNGTWYDIKDRLGEERCT